MATPLHILLLEDDSADAELIAQELARGGLAFDLARIQSDMELHRELIAGPVDLILSDHGLPTFDGFKALQLVRARNPELPFIFVSGCNDQGMVARMYEEGATDYVYKRDLGDLSGTVQRALAGRPLEKTSAPAPSAPPPTGFARLYCCPGCAQASDASGTVVDFWDYYRSHAEIVVLRETCRKCNLPPSP